MIAFLQLWSFPTHPDYRPMVIYLRGLKSWISFALEQSGHIIGWAFIRDFKVCNLHLINGCARIRG